MGSRGHRECLPESSLDAATVIHLFGEQRAGGVQRGIVGGGCERAVEEREPVGVGAGRHPLGGAAAPLLGAIEGVALPPAIGVGRGG